MIVQIKLPSGAKLIPSENSAVKIGEPLYSIGQEDIAIIQISEKLNIKPQDIFAFVSVVVGDQIEENSIIAAKKGLVRRKKVHSPYQGTVLNISHETGEISINKGSQENKSEPSFFNGKITEYSSDDNSIKIEIKAAIELKSKTINNTGGGALFYLLDEKDYFHINETDIKGNHVVLQNIQSQIVTKLEALSASGVISAKGENVSDFPCIILNDESFNKLTTQKYKYIIYSSHTNQVIAYN